jgi:hypothetical protein
MSPKRFGRLSLVAVGVLVSWALVGLLRVGLGASVAEVFSVDPIWPNAYAADSWGAMTVAFDHLQAGSGELVYTRLFLQEQVKFQYPLSSLLIFYVVRDWLTLNWISLVMVVITAALMIVLVHQLLRREQTMAELLPRREPAPLSAIERWALPLLLTFTFFPLVWAYRLGQIQTWLIACTVAMTVLWLSGRRAPAGALVGLMVLVKPQYGFLLIWGLLRRQWGFCGAFAAVAAVGFGASVATFGLGQHLDYFHVLSQLSRHGEGWYANQSVNGLLNRWFLTGDFSDWDLFFLPAYHPAVYWGTMLSTLLLIGLALFGPIRNKGGTLDLFIALFTCTIASPVAWNHHYGVLLPAYAALFIWSLRRPICGPRWTLPLLALSYLLVGTFHGDFNRVIDSRLNVLQSYMFVGGVLVLAFMYRMAAVADPELEPETKVDAPPRLAAGLPAIDAAFIAGKPAAKRG